MAKQLGGFDQAPRKDSFAAKVARSENPDSAVDVSELSEAEQMQLRRASEIDKAAASFTFIDPIQALERVEIVFDNSGSMGGQAIKDAKEGVTEFMKACTPNETAIRITPLNSASYENANSNVIKFTCNLPTIAAKLAGFDAGGGTPLYQKIKSALTNEHRGDLTPSRIIAFSDGQAGDGYARQEQYGLNYDNESQAGKYKDSESHIKVVEESKARGIVIDTCYIWDGRGEKESPTYKTMKAIADDTGGIFILFERGKCDFRRGFKYLTKGNRLLLMDSNFKTKLEAGQI